MYAKFGSLFLPVMVVTPQNVTLTQKIYNNIWLEHVTTTSCNQPEISDRFQTQNETIFLMRNVTGQNVCPYKIGKKSSFRLIAGFSHFVSHLVKRKKGVCEFVSRLSSFYCLVFKVKTICRDQIYSHVGYAFWALQTFFSHHNWTQLDKWLLITYLFKICEALHIDIVSKLSINQSLFFFFHKSRLRAASEVCDSLLTDVVSPEHITNALQTTTG